MERAEAIKIIKTATVYTPEEMEALETLIPELRESEDERIRKWIYNLVSNLDPQNEDAEKELDEMKPLALAWLEKQKEQNSAEVDESTKRLNDNWMKQHFDDYEEQKSAQSREEILHQLFQNGSISLSDYLYITGEQKPAEWNANDKAFIKDCARILDENGYTTSAERLLSMFPIKPAEWSEEDEKELKKLISWLGGCIYHSTYAQETAYKRHIAQWLKSLRPQPQGVYKQIVHSIYEMLKDKDFYALTREHRTSLLNDIRVKCKNADECATILDEPSWKPSEEQMRFLLAVINEPNNAGSESCHLVLKGLYEQLKDLM